MGMFDIAEVVPNAQYGMCMRKHAYVTRDSAMFRAAKARARTGQRMYVYRCRNCKMWHMSHLRHEVTRRKR